MTTRASTELAGAVLETESSPGAEGCPGTEALKTRTLALGMPPASPSASLAIQVAFRREGDEFFATVRTTGRVTGARELQAAGPTCDPLAAATAVVLAVLLDLRSYENPAPSAPSPAQEARVAESGAGAFRSFALHARLDAAFGVLGPAFSVAYGGDARLRWARWELLVGGFVFAERGVELPPGSVDVGLAGANLGACAYFARSGPAEFAGCTSLLVGRYRASGHGYYADDADASLWITGAFGATLALELDRRWALRLAAGVLVPFRRYDPAVDRVGVAYEAPPLAGILGLGPEFRFP